MQCRVCSSENLELAIDLGMHPWGNHFLKKEEVGTEPFYPLRVVFCHDCRCAQLDYTVKKEIMFANHTYLSGMTKTLDNHFKSLAAEVDGMFFAGAPKKSILDIGSNDGTQLKHYKALGYEILGVESSKAIAEMANASGIKTANTFFNLEFAHTLNRKFSLINASGVFFHLEELHSVTDGIKLLLDENGVFVVQFLYMKRIMENLAFDQIYHEHLLYYNLQTIEKLLALHGLSLFDAYLSPIHGGSVMAFATHAGKRGKSERLLAMLDEEKKSKCNEFETYLAFAAEIKKLKERNLAYLAEKRHQGKRIFGMGAPVKGNTLLNYFGVGPETIEFLVEKNPMRKGLYSPGMHIPVILEEDVRSPPDVYYVLAWNFKKEILANNEHLLAKGVEFYFPVEPKDV